MRPIQGSGENLLSNTMSVERMMDMDGRREEILAYLREEGYGAEKGEDRDLLLQLLQKLCSHLPHLRVGRLRAAQLQEVPDTAGCFPLPAPENDVFVPGITPGLSQSAGNVAAGRRGWSGTCSLP